MKDILLSLKTRLSNKGSILSLISLGISLVAQFGIEIDSEKVMAIVQTICAILVALGILNDVTQNDSMYIPGISDKLVTKEEVKEEIKEEIKEEVAAPVVEEVKPVASETQAVNEVEAQVK